MAENENVKPGWKTTEFWISIITAICGVGVLSGYVTPSESNQMVNALGGVAGLVPTVVYIFSRGKAKQGVDINQILTILSSAAQQQNNTDSKK